MQNKTKENKIKLKNKLSFDELKGETSYYFAVLAVRDKKSFNKNAQDITSSVYSVSNDIEKILDTLIGS